jgi:AAA15 family ATPase/GTPase
MGSLSSLAIAGYRSFGAKPQLFPKFRKLNIFVGQNNSGKSNILRYLSEVASHGTRPAKFSLDPLAPHQPGHPSLIL